MMMDPTVCETTIRTPFPMSGERIKGGEKRMASEWEDLETLSKEELIIELVRMRHLYGTLREDMPDTCPLPFESSKRSEVNGESVEGEPTTDEWAERIAMYGAMHPKDVAFYSCDLMDYGLTEDQADEVCERLHREGRLRLPDGVVYYDPSEGSE